jgi:general secretion pathway protein A
MYRSFYQFRSDPFGVIPPSYPLYLSETHREALATLVYGVLDRKPFVAILGEVGVGKSTVLKAALERVGFEPVTIVEASHPLIGPDKVTQMLADAVGVAGSGALTIQDIDTVDRALCADATADPGKRVTFVIDEAQLLPPETLEFIRLVSNMGAIRAGFLQFLLIGQTEFREIIDSHEFRQLGQRIAIRCTISPLSDAEARDYIDFRLRIAGAATPQIMTAGAVQELLRAARGIPRRINVIADNALITGYGQGVRPITAKIMREAVRVVDGGEKRMSRTRIAALVTAVIVLGWGLGATVATTQRPAATAAARPVAPMPVVAIAAKPPAPVALLATSTRPSALPASPAAVSKAQTKPLSGLEAATPRLIAIGPRSSAATHSASRVKMIAHRPDHHNKAVAVIARHRAGAAGARRGDKVAASKAPTDDVREPLQRRVAVAETDIGNRPGMQTSAGDTPSCRSQLIRYCLSIYASWNMPPTLARCVAAMEPPPGVTPAWYALRKVIRAGTIPPLADYTRCLARNQAARATPLPMP